MKIRKCGIDTWNMFKQKHEIYELLPDGTVNTRCQEPATETVHGLDGKPLRGKLCPKHAKELELLMQAVNGAVTAQVSKN